MGEAIGAPVPRTHPCSPEARPTCCAGMAAKQVAALIRLQVKAGSAKPSPPVGPALGQHGVNIMEFCKDFNAKTAGLKDDVTVPVSIRVFSDRSFDYTTKMPPVSSLLKEVAGMERGASNPGKETVAKVTWKQVYAIAQLKSKDAALASIPLESLCKTIAGTARSMGFKVVGEPKAE